MIQVQVSMTDLYGSARFTVEVAGLFVDELERAIKEAYDKWSNTMSHKGAGAVMVSYSGYRVATGSITWWWNGTLSLRLEAADLDWIGGHEDLYRTAIDHTDQPVQEDAKPACCALV